MHIRIFTYYSDYMDSNDYLIVGKFGLVFPSLHIWLSIHNKWTIQLCMASNPAAMVADTKFMDSIKEVNTLTGIPRYIYRHIFNLIFRMDNYGKFKSYMHRNDITIDNTH